jgi:hypothetical protein
MGLLWNEVYEYMLIQYKTVDQKVGWV